MSQDDEPTSFEMASSGQSQAGLSTFVRWVVAVAVLSLVPAVAWAVWIWSSGGGASDTQHILWFLTVAAGVVLAGVWSPRTIWAHASLSCVAFVSTMGTLYAWWSSEDLSGLFMVGIMMAVLPVALASPLLLLIGGSMRYRLGSGAARSHMPRGRA